jgi:hypothetical protein
MSRTSPEDRDLVLDYWRKGHRSKTEISHLTKLDRGTVRKILVGAGLEEPFGKPRVKPDPYVPGDSIWTPPQKEIVAEERQQDDSVSERAFTAWKSKAHSERNRKQLIALTQQVGWQEQILRTMREVVPLLKPGEPIRWNLGPSDEQESMLLHISDFHYGQLIRPEAILGLNAYDNRIARQRLMLLVEKTLKLHRTMTVSGERHFKELVIALNGDLVNGLIHNAEKFSESKNVCESTYQCGQVLAEAIRELARAFPRVRVYATPGNHGRLGEDKKNLDHRDGTRNFDWMAGKYAEVALQNVDNVEFTFSDGYILRYEVQGWTFLQEHGHFIKSVAGVPAAGAKKRMLTLNEYFVMVGGPFHYALSGHFHADHSIRVGRGEVLVNGSIPGVDEYAFYEHNAVGPAVQYLYCVNPDRGVTTREPIYLSPVIKHAS